MNKPLAIKGKRCWDGDERRRGSACG